MWRRRKMNGIAWIFCSFRRPSPKTIENKYNAMFSKMHAESGQTPNTTSMPEQPPSDSNGPTIDEVD